ncbi:hypothetical protein MMS84_28205, partial [Escherichia coli]|nr:hypothetical protein [Escherichia coli]
GTARVAEHDFHAEIAQRLDQDIGSAFLGHRFFPTFATLMRRNIASRRASLVIDNLFVKRIERI